MSGRLSVRASVADRPDEEWGWVAAQELDEFGLEDSFHRLGSWRRVQFSTNERRDCGASTWRMRP